MTRASLGAWLNGHTRLVVSFLASLATLALTALTAVGFAIAMPWIPQAEQAATDARQDSALVWHARSERLTHDSLFRVLEQVSDQQELQLLADCLTITDRVIRAQLRCAQREGGAR